MLLIIFLSYKKHRCYLRWLWRSNISFPQLFFNELCTTLLSSPLTTDTPFSSLAQILSLPQLHDFTPSPLVSSYLLSFWRYGSTCRIFEKPISWPLLWTWLPLSLHSKFLTPLPSFLLPLFFSFLVFLLSFTHSLFTSFLLLLLLSWLSLLWPLLFSTLF